MNDFLGDMPKLTVNGISLERLQYAMKLASGFPAHGYRVDENNGAVVLLQYESAPNMNKFLTPLNAEACATIVYEWLQNQPYPDEDDYFDGSTEKGWLMWTDMWGEIDGHDYHSFLAIKPEWIMFGT